MLSAVETHNSTRRWHVLPVDMIGYAKAQLAKASCEEQIAYRASWQQSPPRLYRRWRGVSPCCRAIPHESP